MAGSPNPKNAGLMSGASADLGLGDILAKQVQDEEDENKKKALKKQLPSQFGDSLMGNAALDLGIR